MAKAVVRTDNLAGIVDGSKLVSVRYYVSTTETAIENGTVVKLDSLIEGTRGAGSHVWKAVAPDANTKIRGNTNAYDDYKLVLIASPEYLYNSNYAGLDEYENEAGKDCLGYVLQPGDTFAVTVDAFASATAPTATNKYILATASTAKLTASNTATYAIAEYLETETEGGYTYYVLRAV